MVFKAAECIKIVSFFVYSWMNFLFPWKQERVWPELCRTISQSSTSDAWCMGLVNHNWNANHKRERKKRIHIIFYGFSLVFMATMEASSNHMESGFILFLFALSFYEFSREWKMCYCKFPNFTFYHIFYYCFFHFLTTTI